MRRTIILAMTALLLTTISIVYFGTGIFRSNPKTEASTEHPAVVAGAETLSAPGLIEAVSEEIEVGTEVPGKLRSVNVEEGQSVVRGQTIAVIENDDYATAVATARAQIATLRSAKATAQAKAAEAKTARDRIANGARPEERVEAKAGYEQTLPEVENSRREYERRERLYRDGIISREEYERSRTTYETAQKRSRSALEHYNLVNAAARQDDVARADAAVVSAASQVSEIDAQIAEAEVRVREAQSRLEKTIVRSPISGVVLRKRLKAGESVSTESPTGIVTVADTSALRVRLDLDETDVARVVEGQTAYVTADAFGSEKFPAKVVKIGLILGRKNFRTERPTEKVDTRILEVLLELTSRKHLPVGLRVDAFITTTGSARRLAE